MAFVGLKHPVAALFGGENDGSAPTYSGGMVVGRAMQADVSFDHADQKLYADDVASESDNSITGGSISIGVDDLSDEAQVLLLGHKKVGSAGNQEIEETSAPAPYVGFGYLRVRRLRGVTSYVGYWLYKVQFALQSEEAKTKGESIEWQTPVVQGSMMGVLKDNSGDAVFRTRKSFATEAEAVAWLNAKAGVAA